MNYPGEEDGHYSSTPHNEPQHIPKDHSLVQAAKDKPRDSVTSNKSHNEYETVSLSGEIAPKDIVEVYDFTPAKTSEKDEYDYESPYWLPSDQKAELLDQMKKLRIPSVAQKDLE